MNDRAPDDAGIPVFLTTRKAPGSFGFLAIHLERSKSMAKKCGSGGGMRRPPVKKGKKPAKKGKKKGY